MNDTDYLVIRLEDLIDYVDTNVHQAVGPANWCVYSSLRAMIDSICAEVEKLIEKSEPVKPVRDKESGRLWLCGSCGSYVGIQDHEEKSLDNYCQECGRKVKWP